MRVAWSWLPSVPPPNLCSVLYLLAAPALGANMRITIAIIGAALAAPTNLLQFMIFLLILRGFPYCLGLPAARSRGRVRDSGRRNPIFTSCFGWIEPEPGRKWPKARPYTTTVRLRLP